MGTRVGFLFKKGAFALDSPSIAGKAAIIPDNAMAWDGDGPDRFGGADCVGNLGIAGGLAGGDLAERLPDALLEGGSANVEREVEPEGRGFDETYDLGDGLFELLVARRESGLWETVLQVAGKGVGVVT